jgi:hypothetical protein
MNTTPTAPLAASVTLTYHEVVGAVVINTPDPIALTGRQAAMLGGAIMEQRYDLGLELGQFGVSAVLDELEAEARA